VISGRMDSRDASKVSTVEYPRIEQHVKHNFGLTETPHEASHQGETQRGVLLLQLDDWTIAYNQTFYLGAIHFARNGRLASPRTRRNMSTEDERLTVSGLELALMLGSQSYEIHSTRRYGGGTGLCRPDVG
jgi:hypothetical protein